MDFETPKPDTHYLLTTLMDILLIHAIYDPTRPPYLIIEMLIMSLNVQHAINLSNCALISPASQELHRTTLLT